MAPKGTRRNAIEIQDDSDEQSDISSTQGEDLRQDDHGDEDSDSEEEDSGSEDEVRNPFIELEADDSEDDEGDSEDDDEEEEEEEEEEDSEDEDDDNDGFGFGTDHSSRCFFPLFRRLPLEIRLMVWERADPYMLSPARVFPFQMFKNVPFEFGLDPILQKQTAPARAILSTNRESRQLALRYYPDTIKLQGADNPKSGLLRYNRKRDIILVEPPIDRFDMFFKLLAKGRPLCDVANIGCVDLSHQMGPVLVKAEETKNLVNVFTCHEDSHLKSRHKLWKGTPGSNSFSIHLNSDRRYLREEVRLSYHWPNTEEGNGGQEEFGLTIRTNSVFDEAGVKSWPMTRSLRFGPVLEKDMSKSSNASRRQSSASSQSTTSSDSDSSLEVSGAEDGNDNGANSNGEDEDEEEEESGSDQDAYESDGLDDGTIISLDSEDSDHDDLLHGTAEVSDDDVEEGEQGPTPSTFAGFSPARDLPEAHFSSPEGDEDVQITAARRLKRKRAIVSSDDEDDNDGDEVADLPSTATSSRPIKRHRAIVLDSEDGDQGAKTPEAAEPTKRRKTVVLSDTEDDDDDEEEQEQDRGDNQRKNPGHNRHRRRVVADESDDDGETSDDESDEEEDSEQEARPLSLAEKLQLHRQKNPVNGSSDSDSDSGNSSSNSSGGPASSNQDDDEEGRMSDDNVLDIDGQSDSDGEEEW